MRSGSDARSNNLIKTFFAVVSLFCLTTLTGYAQINGAIYTTNVGCTGTNVNIFSDKEAVYLDGGPAGGGSGLPDGSYFVKVTEPDGTLLGYSTVAIAQVSGGNFAVCYRLWDILVKASDGMQGYDTSTNGGNVYKVWVSKNNTFPNNESKTDNFKVISGPDVPATARLQVIKFYDANANGVNDDNQPLDGWRVRIQDTIDIVRFTPVDVVVDPDDYTVTESDPVETNWIHTTPNPVNISLAANDNKTVEFGNICLGAGGGMTLGFWSNKNGAALFGADDLALMVALNLRDGIGSEFNPASHASFRPWLLSANATNMAYMLSAQLAAMELNVLNGKVNGNALIYAPALLPYSPAGLNALGFISINNLKAAANAELGTHGTAFAGDTWRAYQEALKNALDKANNNLNFVQATACPFSFQ